MVKNPEKFRRNVGQTSCQIGARSLKIVLAEFKIHGRRILSYQRDRWWLLISGFDKGVNLRTETDKAGVLACLHLSTTS